MNILDAFVSLFARLPVLFIERMPSILDYYIRNTYFSYTAFADNSRRKYFTAVSRPSKIDGAWKISDYLQAHMK